jgi:hypothetical protein
MMSGNLRHDGDPERHGVSVAGVEPSLESVIEHHLRRDLYGDHADHDAG